MSDARQGYRPFSHTLREYVFQLATIISGILIALAVDGVVQSKREQALVEQARGAIAREIASNLEDLEATVPALDKYRGHLETAQRFAEDLLKRGKTDIESLQFPFSMPSLNRSAWQTAERTGALALMDYDEVRRYSELYELQDFVVSSQRQLVNSIAGMSSVVMGGDPMKASPADLRLFRQRALESKGAVMVHTSLVNGLVAAYRRAPR